MEYPKVEVPSQRRMMPYELPIRDGFRRHHIIPIHRMTEAGADILNTKYRHAHAKRIFDAFIHNRNLVVSERLWANGVNPDNFIDKLMDFESATTFEWAKWVWFSIIAWLPGNIVVGPGNRGNDPEDGYDKEAHQLYAATYDARAKSVEQLWTKLGRAFPTTMTFEDLVHLAKGNVIFIEGGWKKGGR